MQQDWDEFFCFQIRARQMPQIYRQLFVESAPRPARAGPGAGVQWLDTQVHTCKMGCDGSATTGKDFGDAAFVATNSIDMPLAHCMEAYEYTDSRFL